MKITDFVLIPAVSMACLFGCSSGPRSEHNTPNIVIIYADDMGYGDVYSFYLAKEVAFDVSF